MMILHPGIGAALLETQGYFTDPVIAIVRNHHERLDGSGYPHGLRSSTSKSVRVVAVCDAFCTMTESRPYENAWSYKAALRWLEAMPEQYDGGVVSALIQMLQAKERGWDPEDTKVTLPVNVVFKQRRTNMSHPRSAFFEAVYPVTN